MVVSDGVGVYAASEYNGNGASVLVSAAGVGATVLSGSYVVVEVSVEAVAGGGASVDGLV